jgi:hypothetical protein
VRQSKITPMDNCILGYVSAMVSGLLLTGVKAPNFCDSLRIKIGRTGSSSMPYAFKTGLASNVI